MLFNARANVDFGTVELPPFPPVNTGDTHMFRHKLARHLCPDRDQRCRVIRYNESMPRIQHDGYGVQPVRRFRRLEDVAEENEEVLLSFLVHLT